MACSIQINAQLTGVPVPGSQNVETLQVSGTASECGKVRVSIENSTTGTTTPVHGPDVNTSGEWSTTFSIANNDFAAGDFVCGRTDKIIVHAVCDTDPNCKTDLSIDQFPISCGDCPTIQIMTATVSDICNDDGSRTVTLSATVTPGAILPVIAQWSFDGSFGPAVNVAAAGTLVEAEFDATEGAQTAYLDFTFPEGCASQQKTFEVPPCDVQPLCPEITLSQSVSDVCDDNGQREVMVNATVALESGAQVSASLKDNDGNVVDTASGAPAPLSHTIQLTPGSYTFSVEVTQPEGCPGASILVEVPQCEPETPPPVCPEIHFDSEVSERCDGDGKRGVRVKATTELDTGDSYSVRLVGGDGNELASVSNDADGQAILQHSDTYAPGDYTFTVEVTEPSGCPEASTTVHVPVCEPESPPPPPPPPECPDIAFEYEVSRRCDEDGRRGVRLIATTELGTGDPYSVRLVDGEGNELASASSGTDGSTTLEHNSTYAPGEYTYTVEVTEPSGCGEVSTTVQVPACKQEPTPFDLCTVLRIFMLLGAGIAIVGLTLLVCPLFAAPALTPTTALIIGGAMTALGAIVFVIFLVAWVIVCQPQRCDFIKLAWQIAAFVMFAFLYVAFCPGCTGWGVIGLVALVVFFALFAWWLFECRPNRCTVFSELLFIMIHIDLIEAVQILLGNCMITSNGVFAGVWVLILGIFTAIAYWGMRRFCPPPPPTG